MTAKQNLDERIARLRSQRRTVSRLTMSPETWKALLCDPDSEFGPEIEDPPFGLFYDGVPVRHVEGMTGVEIDLGPDRE